MPTSKASTVVWKCTWCGRTEHRGSTRGRPMPGNCSRRSAGSSTSKPHVWVKDREY